jgi:hypothetical protein
MDEVKGKKGTKGLTVIRYAHAHHTGIRPLAEDHPL